MSGVSIRLVFLAAAWMAACSGTSWLSAAPPQAQPRLGMNLNGPADWNTELPFVDVFRLSRAWISQKRGAAWGKGPPLALDERGWVTRLEPDCWAETPLCTVEAGHYPSGRYTVLYDGVGRIEVVHAAKVVAREPGQMAIEVDSSQGGFFLQLRETDPADYVRNIRVIMPSFEKTYRQNPFHPVFLQRWQGVACLRFMDWMHTNGSKLSRWSERPTSDEATFTVKGVALETMIDLANRLDADPWFCIPHLADDDFVRRFAELVKRQLEPERKVYVEYSNEVWNGMFEQSRWAGQQGQKRGFADKPWEAAWRYTACRSVQIFDIWEQVFGGTKRLVRVLPTQGANPYVSERVVEFQDAYRHADALAIAPYITCNVPVQGQGLTTAVVEKWTVAQALDHMEKTSLPESIRWIEGQKKVADKYGLKLVAYEGGQHMVGVGGGENNETVTRLFHAANRHPRMGEIYRQYYAAWTAAGGDLFCYFSSVGSWSKWGSWGILQFYDDDPSQSPKFLATMRWAGQCGQSVQAGRGG
ncbi:MAG TPA: hypothetical protein PLF81_13450 [Candidatus Anammoximicrobium sp.]|nr:hypothetical protein [Candidatus Anammoximicrobium sp.]